MNRSRGFTLVELIVVIAITGIVAGVVTMFLIPTLQNYLAVSRRANLTHLADTALRRVVAEIHTAVSNSLRLTGGPAAGDLCLEMVPSSDGGRFRIAPDTQWDAANPANPSLPLFMNQPGSGFDVLTAFNRTPAAGDWIVIGNQNTADVYGGVDSAQIASVGAPPAASMPLGQSRILLAAAKQFPYGYEGGRFYVVPDSLQAVTYKCSGAGLDSNGTGTGTLSRIYHYGFNASQTCAIAGGTAALVATKVSACSFVYSPGQGATQQSGYAQLQLSLSDHGDTATLTVGSQVENLP